MTRYLLPCCILALATPAHAQWRLTAAHGIGTSYHDASDPADPDGSEFHADRLRTWTLALARQHAGWRIAVEGRRATADLTEDGSTSAVTARNVLRAWGVTAELSRRAAGQPGGPSLWLGAGAGFERWAFTVSGGSPAWRLAGRLHAEADVPISPHWTGLARGELGVGGQAFGASDLPDGFVTHTPERLQLYLGIGLVP
ncbi:MAG TPA: hypothetical protein VGM77_01805 [Gemmatimonadales bacterium]